MKTYLYLSPTKHTWQLVDPHLSGSGIPICIILLLFIYLHNEESEWIRWTDRLSTHWVYLRILVIQQTPCSCRIYMIHLDCPLISTHLSCKITAGPWASKNTESFTSRAALKVPKLSDMSDKWTPVGQTCLKDLKWYQVYSIIADNVYNNRYKSRIYVVKRHCPAIYDILAKQRRHSWAVAKLLDWHKECQPFLASISPMRGCKIPSMSWRITHVTYSNASSLIRDDKRFSMVRETWLLDSDENTKNAI